MRGREEESPKTPSEIMVRTLAKALEKSNGSKARKSVGGGVRGKVAGLVGRLVNNIHAGKASKAKKTRISSDLKEDAARFERIRAKQVEGLCGVTQVKYELDGDLIGQTERQRLYNAARAVSGKAPRKLNHINPFARLASDRKKLITAQPGPIGAKTIVDFVRQALSEHETWELVEDYDGRKRVGHIKKNKARVTKGAIYMIHQTVQTLLDEAFEDMFQIEALTRRMDLSETAAYEARSFLKNELKDRTLDAARRDAIERKIVVLNGKLEEEKLRRRPNRARNAALFRKICEKQDLAMFAMSRGVSHIREADIEPPSRVPRILPAETEDEGTVPAVEVAAE